MIAATCNLKLGDVAQFIRGITFKPTDVILPDEMDAVVCMRTKNVQADLDESDLIAIPPKFVRRDEQYLREGDILVSSANSWELVGKSCWVPNLEFRATAGGFISILRANRARVVPRYLYHWITSPSVKHALRHCGRQTTNISNLSFERALALPIPLPFPDDPDLSLAEQKRIAAILDKADTVRRSQQDALIQAGGLLEATFVEMFGDPVTNPRRWDTYKLSDLSTRVTVGIVVKPASYYVPEGVPALRSMNVRANRIDPNNLVYFSPEDNESILTKTRVWENDVVLVRSGQPGTAAVVPKSMDGVNAIDILIVSPDPLRVSSWYLACFFNSEAGKRMVLGQQRGQIQKHLNVGSLNRVVVPVAPLPEQRRFDSIVGKIFDLKSQVEQSADGMNDLFNSLVQRAFRGEL